METDQPVQSVLVVMGRSDRAGHKNKYREEGME